MASGDAQSTDGLKVIDLGAGHSSSSETLGGRVVAALKSGALLNESVGAGYIDRHWPPAFKDAGAWPLTSLRQSFLSGALTRLMDPDAVLRRQVVDFVTSRDFGLASGDRGGGEYERVWCREPVGVEEVAFESGIFLLTKAKAELLKKPTDDTKPLQLGMGDGGLTGFVCKYENGDWCHLFPHSLPQYRRLRQSSSGRRTRSPAPGHDCSRRPRSSLAWWIKSNSALTFEFRSSGCGRRGRTRA